MTVSEILKENPVVSIVIPMYNTKSLLKSTLDSVFRQTYTDWEMILIDDCSTDGTYEYAKQIADTDERIRVFRLKKNSGPGIAARAGLKKAAGGIAAFLDSDDLWKEDKLERQLEFMKRNNYHITCTDYEQIDQQGQPLGRVIKAKKRADYRQVLLTCPIGSSSVMASMELLSRVNIPGIRKCNDYMLWLRILRVYPYIYGMQESLMKYRIWPQSISYNKLKKIKYFWISWRKYEQLSLLQSLLLLTLWTAIKILKIK